MHKQITVQQLADETNTEAVFLLKKIKQVGLRQTRPGDLLNQQDIGKIKEALGQRRKTLRRKDYSSRDRWQQSAQQSSAGIGRRKGDQHQKSRPNEGDQPKLKADRGRLASRPTEGNRDGRSRWAQASSRPTEGNRDGRSRWAQASSRPTEGNRDGRSRWAQASSRPTEGNRDGRSRWAQASSRPTEGNRDGRSRLAQASSRPTEGNRGGRSRLAQASSQPAGRSRDGRSRWAQASSQPAGRSRDGRSRWAQASSQPAGRSRDGRSRWAQASSQPAGRSRDGRSRWAQASSQPARGKRDYRFRPGGYASRPAGVRRDAAGHSASQEAPKRGYQGKATRSAQSTNIRTGSFSTTNSQRFRAMASSMSSKSKPDTKSAAKDKKSKHALLHTKDLLDRERKALKRYGIRISAEEAMEMEEIKRKERVQNVHSIPQRVPIRDGIGIANVHKFIKPTQQVVKKVVVEDAMGVPQLAHQLGMKSGKLLQKINQLGFAVKEGDSLEKEATLLVIEELGHKAINGVKEEKKSPLEEPLPANVLYAPRPPLITVMGHVDHGKTTLLDFIRRTKQVDKEAGQITQHLGAYRAQVKDRNITFFDTPGHAAFSEMRQMGTRMTDIVVLVVAADDGIMPQTREVITYIQAAQVPVIVAINKMDKEGMDAEKVRKEVSALGLLPESWGGDVPFVEISALTGQGVNELLESLQVQADIMELKAAINVSARGRVIESRLDKSMGPVSMLLVQDGVLKKGDIVCTEDHYGRIRMMFNDVGQLVQEAKPAEPVEVLGMSGVPQSGSRYVVVSSEKEARQIVENYTELRKLKQNNKRDKLDLDAFMAGDKRQLTVNLIVKADVSGSLEAIRKLVNELEDEETKINIVAQSVGAIRLTDVHLAETTGALIVGFNVRADNEAKKEMKQHAGTKVHYFSIIYELGEELQRVMREKTAMHGTEKIIGIATVKEVFSAKKYGQIAGSEVVEGVVHKDKPIRVLRDNTVIYEGTLESLRRFKEDVTEVRQGVECGIGVKDYRNVKVGDQIEVYDKRVN